MSANLGMGAELLWVVTVLSAPRETETIPDPNPMLLSAQLAGKLTRIGMMIEVGRNGGNVKRNTA